MVFANYFEVAGTPIIEGRAFTEADINAAGQSGVVIVNRAMARTFWPGQSAINKPVPLDGGGTPPNVIGVAENAREFNLGEDIKPMIYFPGWAWADLNDLTLLIRTAGDPAVVPGGRATLIIDLQLKPGMHVYAPGAKDYEPLREAGIKFRDEAYGFLYLGHS